MLAAGCVATSTQSPPPPQGYVTVWGERMHGVSAGTFTGGGGTDDEAFPSAVHDMTLTHNFWIGETEVSRAAWESDAANAAWSYRTLPDYPCTTATTAGDCPADSVQWSDAAQYSNALSDEEGLARCYSDDGSDTMEAWRENPYSCPGYRLPTEAEWEYSARAGGETQYAGSDHSVDVAWTYETADSKGTFMHEVATLAPNNWGLFDMSGNVYEWTHDRYSSEEGGYVSGARETDPFGPDSGDYLVIRGGDWAEAVEKARVFARSYCSRACITDLIGFRLARTAP